VDQLPASRTLADQDALYPLEFFVAATPISLQPSRQSKARWKARVAEAARQRVGETDELGFLDRRPLAVTVYYFSAAPTMGDIDNIVKPIMDALIRVAYMDDQDVERVVIQKFDPDVDWDFADPSDQLAAALDIAAPVVYVRVDDDPSWRIIR
jgi:crossover junction endodeoxyribonuclease RusA